MPHKKKENIRKLTRMGSGRSIGLTLPADILHELHWREKQRVIVTRKGKSIVINDWLVRRTQGKKK